MPDRGWHVAITKPVSWTLLPNSGAPERGLPDTPAPARLRQRRGWSIYCRDLFAWTLSMEGLLQMEEGS